MRSRRARRVGLATLLALSAVPLLGNTPAALADRQPVPPRTRPAIGSSYQTQKLTWRGCLDPASNPGLSAAYYRLQCATLTAPMDWANPDGGSNVKIAVSRLLASHSPAKGVLFTNPGGPGGAGVDLPLLFISDERTQLTRSQNIYGMDVRGTGSSTNVTCGGAPASLLDPRDRTAANLDLIMDGAELNARSCALAGGALINDVTTNQTVRDLDLLRQVIGAPKVNWLGYSAGTWLGAQYATAFPQNVGHLVLDSNVDFTGTWQDAFDPQPMGFERRFRLDFLPWVAKYRAVYRLGTTANAVDASYEQIRAGLQPDVPIDSAVTLDQLLAGALYSTSLFPLAASVLGQLDTFLAAERAGNGPAMSAARGRVAAVLPLLRRVTLPAEPFASHASSAAFLAVTCNDTPWTAGRPALIQTSQQLGEASPLIGWSTVSQPCAFWQRPDISTPVPTGAGVPPVLMVQSEHDPATPIEGARRAAAEFAGARLLTVTHEGDHGVYAGGNACVDQAVETFIVLGTLPAVGATCPGRPVSGPPQGMAQAGALGRTSAAQAGAGVGLGGGSVVPPPGTNPLLALRVLSSLVGAG